jgi:BlaI family penicillinase repressor
MTDTPPRPTDAELAILRVLWRHGDATVREVLRRYNEDNGVQAGYTTILKMLQIMADKGLVLRDDSRKPQVYAARLSEGETQRQLVRHLLDKAFDGSTKRLVLQALAGKRVGERELRRVERLLDSLEESER